MPNFTFTATLLSHQFPFDLEVGSHGELLHAKDRFRDLPEVARRLTLGDSAPAFYQTLDLYLDLLHYAVPLWHYGLSVPEEFADIATASPDLLRLAAATQRTDKWVDRIHQTFNDHGPHWYHVAHVLTQIIMDLSKPVVDWTQIVYLLQAGGPFFEPIISRLLRWEVTDPSLQARLLNALLFFPSPKVWDTAKLVLALLKPGESIGHQSLVRTLGNFDNPESRFFRKRFFEYAAYTNSYLAIHAGLERPVSSCMKAAWREIGKGNHTNQTDVEYILRKPDGRINELVETLAEKPDWCELLGRFRQAFLNRGYQGALVPDLDGFVKDNLESYKWPSGERHHNRIDPEIRHALYQQRLLPKTLDLLHEQLHDKDQFRRDNAAMHLAAFCQSPRILVRRKIDGQLEAYFQEPPEPRPPLAAETIARLLSLTVDDHRVTAYHFAARAVSQLVLDPVHGPGITDYLLARAAKNRQGTDLVFCTYLLLPTYHLQDRQAEIRALLPEAISVLKQRPQAAFGRLLVQLHDAELTHLFLAKIAPQQAGETYAMFEELAQSVNLLHDEFHGLSLPVFHPGFPGADDHPGKRL